MKCLYAMAAGLCLAACNVQVNHDEKTGDIKSIHLSIADFDNLSHKEESHSVTESRKVTAVRSVEVAGAVALDVEVGGEPKLTVTGDSKRLKFVETKQDGDRLIVRTKDAYGSEIPMVVHLTTPSLAALRGDGSGDVHVSGFSGGDFSLDMTGKGDVDLQGKVAVLTVHLIGSGDLDATKLQVAQVSIDSMGAGHATFGTLAADRFEATVKGSGNVSAEGQTKVFKGSVLGSGGLEAGELHADLADIDVMGSGDVEISTSDAVRVHTMGAGNVTVHGKPNKREITGSGNIAFD